MDTILKYSEFINSGLPVSDDIDQKEIEATILIVENFYLKPAITDENYIELLAHPQQTENKIITDGGDIENVHYVGLKKAIGLFTFAYMLVNSYRLTRYGSVEKRSEFSINGSSEELYLQARVNWEVGMSVVREVQRYYGLPDDRNDTNNLFNTLLY